MKKEQLEAPSTSNENSPPMIAHETALKRKLSEERSTDADEERSVVKSSRRLRSNENKID